MKKISVIACVIILMMTLLAGCQKGEPNAEQDSLPSEETITLQELIENIKALEEEGMYEKIDGIILQEQMGITTDDAEDFYGYYSPIITQVVHIVGVKAKDGKVDAVKEGLEKRKTELEEHYLPDQAEIASQGVVLEKGEYVFLLILGYAPEDAPGLIQQATAMINEANLS